MRTVVQRVKSASVEVEGKTVSSIKEGLLVLAGLHKEDTERDVEYITEKVTGARIFDDQKGVMNLSVVDTAGEILIVSQFTLLGDMRKGRRPSYSNAMPPEEAKIFFDILLQAFNEKYNSEKIQAGVFGADMKVSLENWGPVTILLDSNRQM